MAKNCGITWYKLNTYFMMLVTVMVPMLVTGQPSCENRICYPQTGDLMIGRASNLTTTSTCGLRQRQRYCIIAYLQEENDCSICYAREPKHSHMPSNMISIFDGDKLKRWWQSENGKEEVSIRLDLEAQFQFTHIIMKFRTYRPAGMLIERSWDYGRTWKVYRYFASDCRRTFPGISMGPQRKNSDVICTEEYSGVSPSTEGEVIFRALNPQIPVKDLYSDEVLNLLKLTNLRINFTKLHTLGDNLLDPRPEIQQKYYYSVYELVVRGSCSCYGHAERCLPSSPDQENVDGMVYGRCDCTHNTEGFNCERCKKGYVDRPWAPAFGDQTNECVKCECNGHATECRFDEAVYIASNKTSGGVCLNCSDNTFGRKCEKCKPLHYQDPTKDFSMPGACLPCNCDSIGGVGGGECEGKTDPAAGLVAGKCICKKNVAGVRCDRCKPGYYDLTASPEGCKPCSCHPNGTIGVCDSITGVCICKRNTRGKNCDICAPNHYGLGSSPSGCSACECDLGGSLRQTCDQLTGQCLCRKGITGRRCNQLLPGYYYALLDHLKFEAENARILGTGKVVKRERPQSETTLWTGDGYVEVSDGTILENVVTKIPYTGVYKVLIRYDSKNAGDWNVRVDVSRLDGRPLNTSACSNTGQPLSNGFIGTTLFSRRQYSQIQPGICLEKDVAYVIKITYTRLPGNTAEQLLFVDSVVLIPNVDKSPVFQGTNGNRRLEQFKRYRCLEYYHFQAVRPRRQMPEACKTLIYSLSTIIYDGGLACACDPAGTVRDSSGAVICEQAGGQCRCKSNVIGRRCDRCAPGTYGFGLNGCSACNCDELGSLDNFCDVRTGQCKCNIRADGRQCSMCPPSQWGFPACQPCECNNHSPKCDPQTGVCQNCQHDTTGNKCEKCREGFYGDATRGTPADCIRCRCPGGSNQFSKTCRMDSSTSPPSLLCDNCTQGYTGRQCEECADGYYGNPLVPGGSCKPCDCNSNTNSTCDKTTGRCYGCLYNTTGFSCERCRPGYYGNALARNCSACVCNKIGQDPTFPDSCDHITGQCICRPHVTGIQCDRCVTGYWNIASGKGCQKCDCCSEGIASSGCNQIDGKCNCRAGFGGPRCCECEHGFWGKTPDQCKACNCNPAGSVSLQCDKRTGKCRCKQGTVGDKCDSCDVHTEGRMPMCEPCGECYHQWKVVLDNLSRNVTIEIGRAQNLVVDEQIDTKAYDKELKALEERLEYVRQILNNQRTTENDTQIIEDHLEEISTKLNETTNLVKRVDATVGGTIVKTDLTNKEIEELRRRLQELIMKGDKLEEDVRNIRDSDARGAYESLKESQRRSRAAEKRVNASEMIVKQSMAEREMQDTIGKQTPDGNFDVTQQQNEVNLNDILRRIQELMRQSDILNGLVCGTPSEQCGGCGPMNCSFCGGPGCSGVKDLALEAVRKAFEAHQAMQAKEAQANRTLFEARMLEQLVNTSIAAAKEAKNRAEQAQKEADGASMRMQKLIKDILEWLAQKYDDPYKIGELAKAVLNVTLSVTPEEILDLTTRIKEALAKLTGLDEIIEGTRKEREDALELKRRAQKAKDDASAVNDIVKNVTDALLKAQQAQNAARGAINSSQIDTSLAADILKNRDRDLDALEMATKAANKSCSEMKKEIPLLRQEYNRNKELVEKVEDDEKRAFNASQFSMSEAQRLKKMYEEAKWKIDHLSKNISDAARRVRKLKQNATSLREDLQKKLKIIHTIYLEEVSYDALKEGVKAAEDEMGRLLNLITKMLYCYTNCNPSTENNCDYSGDDGALSEAQKELLKPPETGAK